MLPDRHGGNLADRDFFEYFEPRRRWRPPGIFQIKTDFDDFATSRPLSLRLGAICEQCWVQFGDVAAVGHPLCPHGGER